VPEPIAAFCGSHCPGNGLVDRLEIEPFRIELSSDPSAVLFVLIMFWVSPGFEETGVSRATSHIFGRSRAATGDTARIIYPNLTGYAPQNEEMAPIITEIVLVPDAERWVFVKGKCKILQTNFGCFEDAVVRQAILVELRRADGQSPNVKLMKVAVGPTESGLQDLMELGEVEFHRQFQSAADPGFDVDDVDLCRYHE
jgi:hypothetical protein